MHSQTHTHIYPGLINIHAEWHNMAGLKRSPPTAGIQAFLSLPNSFILFKQGLNLLWNTAEFSCSGTSGPGGTQSGKSPLFTTSADKSGPLLLFSVGTMVQEGRGRVRHLVEDLKWPNTTCQHSLLSSDHTEPNYRNLLWKRWGPQQAPALAGTSHQTVALSYSCIKRRNTSRYLPLHPHHWTSFSPWR